MKKKLLTALLSLTLVFALLLTGCVNQGMADKINEKAKSEEGYTYAQLIQDYKDPTIDLSTTVLGVTNGVIIYVAGCKTAEEVEAKYEKDGKVNAVYVTIALNKVVSAEYTEYSPEKE